VVIFQENVSFDHYFATYPVRRQQSHRAHIYGLSQNSFGERTQRTATDGQPERRPNLPTDA